MSQKQIFLLDDEEFWLSKMIEALNKLSISEENGWKLFTFKTGEALEAACQNGSIPDLILSDYTLEKGESLPFLRRIKLTHEGTFIILCTRMDRDVFEIIPEEIPYHAFLSKYDLHMVDKVRNVLSFLEF